MAQVGEHKAIKGRACCGFLTIRNASMFFCINKSKNYIFTVLSSTIYHITMLFCW